jgi:hypothetical protein
VNSSAHPIRPLFLLSLPRSGSTLVQRVLAGSPEISTASETWLLMPFLAATESESLPSRGAWDVTAAEGIADFGRELPAGLDSYRRAVHDFAIDLYEQAAEDGATYFLDKTPPYAHFLPELARTFPEARFIALFRNPLAVVASVVETFSGGRWEPDRYPLSLYTALEALISSTQTHPDRVHPVRFEDLATGDPGSWRGLMDFLGLGFDPDSLGDFDRVALNGRLGDKHGTARYSRLSAEPLGKWKQTIDNPLRRAWCRRYLDWIGPQRLEVMGYDHAELRRELDATPVGRRHLATDSMRAAESIARRSLRRRLTSNGHPRPSAGARQPAIAPTGGEARG